MNRHTALNENLGINRWALLPDDPFIMGFIIVLIGIAVLAVIVVLFDAIRASRAIKTAENIFKAGHNGEDSLYLWSKSIQDHESSTPASTTRWPRRRHYTAITIDAWREFKETLVEVRDGIRNTIPADYFFNSQQFAPHLSGNRFLHAAPTTLTGIGLLGTFIGLTSGLSGLDLTTDSTTDMQEGIGQLVASASLGFASSVWGIALSILVTLIMRGTERHVNGKTRALASRIDRALEFQTAERSLAEIERHSSDSAGSLNELHEKIGTSLQEAIQGMSTELQEALSSAITSSMTPAMEAITDRSMEQSQEVFSQLVEKFAASFTDLGERQAAELATASEAINTSLKKVSTDLDHTLGSLDEALKQQASAHTEQTRELVSLLEKVTLTANEVVSAVQQAALRLENMGDKLQEGAQSLETSSRQLGQTAGEFARHEASLAGAVTLATSALTEIRELQGKAAEIVESQIRRSNELFDSSQKMSTELRDAFNLLVSAFPEMENQQHQFLRNLRSEYDAVQTNMEKYLAEYSNQIRTQTFKRLEEFNSATQQYAGHMLEANEGLGGIMETLEVKLEAIRNSTPA